MRLLFMSSGASGALHLPGWDWERSGKAACGRPMPTAAIGADFDVACDEPAPEKVCAPCWETAKRKAGHATEQRAITGKEPMRRRRRIGFHCATEEN